MDSCEVGRVFIVDSGKFNKPRTGLVKQVVVTGDDGEDAVW